MDEYNCGSTNSTTAAYLTPFPTTGSSAETYQVVNFSSDYRTSDTTTSLSTTSNLVRAARGKSGCNGLQAIGGYGTFYAQAINAAQADLAAEKALYPNSQNVMIILSDGDATATCTTSVGGVCTAGAMKGASVTAATGAYPPQSTKQECHQAVAAAQAAATAGTRVYSVAYGAAASGCASDTSPTITPC
jgi:hypothetical protein